MVKDVAEEMQIPGKNGYLGILPGHAPLDHRAWPWRDQLSQGWPDILSRRSPGGFAEGAPRTEVSHPWRETAERPQGN